MDRRQNRTRKAVFQAMVKLLPQKDFARITVQEIIDEADIGRSTFYTHFETKEDLLRSLCDYMFEKIWTQAAAQTGERPPLEALLVQVLEQGKKYRQVLQSMYAGDACPACSGYIREALEGLFRDYLPEMETEGVPERFVLHHLAGSFSDALHRWIREDCPEEPEEIVEYYLRLTRIYTRN